MTELLDTLQTPGGLIRHASALLCVAAFGGLLWRLIGRLHATRTLVTALTALLALIELIVALGTARRAALGGPANEAHWFIIAHALAVLVLVFTWDRIPHSTERRTP